MEQKYQCCLCKTPISDSERQYLLDDCFNEIRFSLCEKCWNELVLRANANGIDSEDYAWGADDRDFYKD
jgi:hypothetical protein